MAKVLEPAEERVFLRGVSWRTYECLLADNEDRSVPRLAYDRGLLEIMSPSTEHEGLNRNIALLVEVLAEELGIDVFDAGSTTFKRADLQRGFEPDSCFYIQNEERIRGKARIDLTVDPPPDLLIEIDITSWSLDKLPMYALLGIPEVWRHDETRLIILRLDGEAYAEAAYSGVLPSLDGAAISDFVNQGRTLPRTAWLRRVREWVRGRGRRAGDPRS